VIDSVLLRPLPFPEPDQLMTIFNTYRKLALERDGSSLTNYYERRGRIPAFASLSIYRYGRRLSVSQGRRNDSDRACVSGFFLYSGLGPAIGRTFTDEEPLPKPTTLPFFPTHFGGNDTTPIPM